MSTNASENYSLINSNASDSRDVSEEEPRSLEPETKYSYLILVAGFFNLAIVFGNFSAFGIFQEFYLNVLFKDQPASTISWIGTITFSLTLGGGVFHAWAFFGQFIDSECMVTGAYARGAVWNRRCFNNQHIISGSVTVV
ncbi:hypothetical protein AYI70_g4932 [Smittium culicis]|uniref:Uncharacterized protein n=1 Tax=Smittium culicis TaxID=133412 RepID=A0A1R1XX25_9FUNG|nr:hypothetical protein AYI70_g4932 [Smittium culicis]